MLLEAKDMNESKIRLLKDTFFLINLTYQTRLCLKKKSHKNITSKGPALGERIQKKGKKFFADLLAP